MCVCGGEQEEEEEAEREEEEEEEIVAKKKKPSAKKTSKTDAGKEKQKTSGGGGGGSLAGKTVVLTGALSTRRTDMVRLLKQAGAKIGSGVSKNTDILVAGDKVYPASSLPPRRT
jgi:DNA ligase (NAD+)